jgi:uncharacterized protein
MHHCLTSKERSSGWIKTSRRTFTTASGSRLAAFRVSPFTSRLSSLTLVLLALVLLPVASALAVTPQELLAHPPTRYFNDYAGVVSASDANALNTSLVNFEKQTSNQFLVVIFPQWPDDLVFDDYAQALFRAAKIGQAGKSNGALVLVSIKEHKFRIHTGYGLEGSLPDALCNRIREQEFAPEFRAGNYAEGFRRGLAAMMAATKGEYQGNGRTAHQQKAQSSGVGVVTLIVLFLLIIFICILLFAVAIIFNARRGVRGYGPGSTGPQTGGGGFFFGGPGGGGGFSDRGGGSSGGGGDDGGFSGGGGDSGGGGASGDW